MLKLLDRVLQTYRKGTW